MFLHKNSLKGFFLYHYWIIMDNEKTPKTPKTFECEKCVFICCNKKDYNRHLSTRKHLMAQNDNEKTQKTPKNPTRIRVTNVIIFTNINLV